MPSRRNSVLIFSILSILYFFSIFHRVGTAVIALNIMDEFKTDSSILGLMSSMYFWPYAFAQIPVGILLDRVGIRKTITALGLIACLGNLLFSISPSITLLAVGRALLGFGLGGFYVSALKALAVWYEPRRFATLTGSLTAIGNFGGVVASSPLALLTLAIGWRDSFLIVFFFMLLFIGIAWFVVKGDEQKGSGSIVSITRDLKRIFSTREFLKITLVPLFAYGFFISFQGLWGGPFLSDIYRMGESAIGNFLIFIAIGFMAGVPLAGFISDRMRRRKPVLLAGLLMSLSFWIIMSLDGSSLATYMLPFVLFLLGFAFGFDNIYMTISKELFDVSICGMSMACCNIFNFIGGGFFQFFMGFVLSTAYGGTRVFGAYQLIFILGVVCLGAALIVALIGREAYSADTCPG